jgi:hypothetical protein
MAIETNTLAAQLMIKANWEIGCELLKAFVNPWLRGKYDGRMRKRRKQSARPPERGSSAPPREAGSISPEEPE